MDFFLAACLVVCVVGGAAGALGVDGADGASGGGGGGHAGSGMSISIYKSIYKYKFRSKILEIGVEGSVFFYIY